MVAPPVLMMLAHEFFRVSVHDRVRITLPDACTMRPRSRSGLVIVKTPLATSTPTRATLKRGHTNWTEGTFVRWANTRH